MPNKISSEFYFRAPILAFALVCLMIPSMATAQSNSDELKISLSHRHEVPSLGELEKIAGGREELIVELLNLRTVEMPPFLSLRAEKLLLNFADDERVVEALAADIEAADRTGLARVVVMNVDSVENGEARQRIASAALERAGRDKDFQRHARFLLDSSDTIVSRMAREQLE